jgi:organic radical activating enzyme
MNNLWDLEKPKTRTQWILSNICNFSCWYCPDHLRNGTTRGQSAERVGTAVAYLSRLIRAQAREPSYDFQGGEPTFNETLISALSNVGSNQSSNRLTTNGSADLEWWKQNYFYFTEIEISYHPRYASFDHTVSVARFLQSQETPPSITIKVHATSVDSEWQQAYDAWERFQSLGLPSELKLLYTDFTKGRTRMPYRTYQMQQYAMSRGEAPDPAIFQRTDPTGYLPLSRNVHYVDELVPAPSQTLCHSGIDQLVVWHTGEVYRGWCKASGSLGNVFAESVELPTEPIVCPFRSCRNGFDQQNTKEVKLI